MLTRCKEFGFTKIFWRCYDGGRSTYIGKLIEPYKWDEHEEIYQHSPGYIPAPEGETLKRCQELDYYGFDTLKAAVDIGHELGLEIYGWMSINEDDHGIGWPSRFSREHPECRWTRRNGEKYHSQLSFAFPAVREYKLGLVQEVLGYDVDGILLDWIRTGDIRDNPQADEIGTEMAMVFHAHEEGDAATDVATPAKEAAERLVALRAELKKVHCPIDCRGLVNAMETVLKEAERFYRQWARMGTFSAERQKRSQRAYEAYLSTADRYYFDPVCLEDEVSSIFTNDCVALAVAANDWGATLNAAATPSAGGGEALPDSSFYSDDYPFISGLWRVLNGQGYSPFLASAFLCWRRDVQNEQYGFYEWANIPNREYNVIRFRALDRVEAYLRSNPGDVHAQAQRDVLLYTPNIGRAGNKGEALRPDVIGRADGCL
jgi:hypothetical protein